MMGAQHRIILYGGSAQECPFLLLGAIPVTIGIVSEIFATHSPNW